MTSYQKRKAEINELKAKVENAEALAREVKHYFLALARGKLNYSEQCKVAILKRLPSIWAISDDEKEELDI